MSTTTQVRDAAPAEFYRHATAKFAFAPNPPDGTTVLEMARFDHGWLYVPRWLPISSNGLTCRRLFTNFTRDKFDDAFKSIDEVRALSRDAPAAIPRNGAFMLGGDPFHNIYHTIIDFVPNLAALHRHPDLRERPILCHLSERQSGIVRTLLSDIGIDDARLVQVPPTVPFLEVEDLVVPAAPTMDQAVRAWSDVLWPERARPTGTRRLFVRRDGVEKRRLLNQDEISRFCVGHGFEAVDPGALPIEDQMRLFAESEIIIGSHGAALTNILFAPEGATVVELFAGVHQPFYEELAKRRLQRFVLVEGETRDPSWHHADFTVALDDLKAVLPA